jgi:Na+/melibiose symporter-like transporter
VIKWIFGLVSDRYPLFGRGHRVPYMLIGLVATAVAFGVAFFIDPSESFPILAAMVLAATFFMALFDTTADAAVQAWMTAVVQSASCTPAHAFDRRAFRVLAPVVTP